MIGYDIRHVGVVSVMLILMGCRTGMASTSNSVLEKPPGAIIPAAESATTSDAAAQVSEGPTPNLDSSPEVYLDVISRLQGNGLYFASLAHLDAFDRRWPNTPRASLMRADAYRETGYPDRALALYDSLLQGTYAASAHHGIGLIASKRGDLAAALQALLRANQLDPTNASFLNDLGYVQLLARQMDDAGFSLHKATELDPKDVRAGANLALFYLLDNKPDKANGIMDWYRLTDKQRKDILESAADLISKPNTPSQSPVFNQ